MIRAASVGMSGSEMIVATAGADTPGAGMLIGAGLGAGGAVTVVGATAGAVVDGSSVRDVDGALDLGVLTTSPTDPAPVAPAPTPPNIPVVAATATPAAQVIIVTTWRMVRERTLDRR